MSKHALSVAVLVMFGASVASATVIGPAENGDFSAGDTSNWTIEAGDTYKYEDVGGAHAGTLRRDLTSTSGNYDKIAFCNTEASMGQQGSIDFKLNNSVGTFGIGFLGDPNYSVGNPASINNNEYNRGYQIYMPYGGGNFTPTLHRKTGGWSTAAIDTGAAISGAVLNDGQWHTFVVHDDGTGEISVDLDGVQILSVSQGANYLPTVYGYAGSHWGVYTYYESVDISIDNLTVENPPPPLPIPEPAGLSLLGLALLGLRRRRS